MQTAERVAVSLSAVVMVSLLFGCWTRPASRGASEVPLGSAELRPSTTQSSIPPEYRLGFGDVVDIKFFRNSKFDLTLTVRPDGRISLPKVGELSVTGMTPSTLDSVITAAYAEFVRDPEITVIVTQFGGYRVYVLGEVNNPGGYAIQRNMTLLHAMASAGGPKNTAKMGSVMIIRRDETSQVQAFKVDLAKSLKARQGLDVGRNDLSVQAQDIIYVPKTAIASVSDFMRQLYAGILPPLDLYLRALIIDRNL